MPSQKPKRTLSELKELYKLEPSLKNIYVEGPNDKKILEWFVKELNKYDIRFYPIDSVEIPSDVLQEYNLQEHSCRDKVIALSKVLCGLFHKDEINIKCIIDADYDRHLNRCIINNILNYTDYTSMEMYLYNIPFINKFIKLVLNGFPISTEQLIKDMNKILQEMFLIRLTNEKLGWKMEWLDSFRKYIVWKGNRMEFDRTRYIRNYLGINRKGNQLDFFQSEMDALRQQFQSDIRHNIRGHDFTYLFYLYAKRFKRYSLKIGDIDAFENILWGSIETVMLKDSPLFVMLSNY